MENLIKALQKWLKRNQPEAGKETGEKRRERHMLSKRGRGLKLAGVPTAYLSARNHTHIIYHVDKTTCFERQRKKRGAKIYPNFFQ
jgi:hypothetical protein